MPESLSGIHSRVGPLFKAPVFRGAGVKSAPQYTECVRKINHGQQLLALMQVSNGDKGIHSHYIESSREVHPYKCCRRWVVAVTQGWSPFGLSSLNYETGTDVHTHTAWLSPASQGHLEPQPFEF